VQVGAGGAGDAEVADLRLTGLVDRDVGRLEVPVDDAAVVGMLHGVADALDEELNADTPSHESRLTAVTFTPPHSSCRTSS
jgi:hypothetical protein